MSDYIDKISMETGIPKETMALVYNRKKMDTKSIMSDIYKQDTLIYFNINNEEEFKERLNFI